MKRVEKMEPDSSWRCTAIGQEVADNLEHGNFQLRNKENISYFEGGHIPEKVTKTDCEISVIADI